MLTLTFLSPAMTSLELTQGHGKHFWQSDQVLGYWWINGTNERVEGVAKVYKWKDKVAVI